MNLPRDAVLLRIFIGESDRWEHKPLCEARSSISCFQSSGMVMFRLVFPLPMLRVPMLHLIGSAVK